MRATLSDDERGSVGAERIAVWLIPLLAVGFVAAAVVQPGLIAATPPEASFAGSYNAETNTLQVEHAGGDAVRAGPTSSLVLVVADVDGGTTQNVSWATDEGESVSGYPVKPGDSIAIDDPSVDSDGDGNTFDGDATVGFELDDDTVAVVWRGRPLGAPGQESATLETLTIGTSR